MDKLKPNGRVAMRVEGDWLVAYYAEPETMQGAVYLGRVHMRVVENKRRKAMFFALIKDFVGEVLSEFGSVKWGEYETAPESERSGRG